MESISFRVLENGSTADSIAGLDAIVVLVMSVHGNAHLAVAGDTETLRPLLIHGILNWPMFRPFAPEKREVVEALLLRTKMRDPHEAGVQLRDQAEAQKIGAMLAGSGSRQFARYDILVEQDSSRIAFSGSSFLIFGTHEGTHKIGRGGAGSEKFQMMEHAIELLWGNAALQEALEILEGDIPEPLRSIMRQMRRNMRGQEPGTIRDYTEDDGV